jgi:hypothetical protein
MMNISKKYQLMNIIFDEGKGHVDWSQQSARIYIETLNLSNSSVPGYPRLKPAVERYYRNILASIEAQPKKIR